MKKGTKRIAFGLILIFLQFLSFVGNMKSGVNFNLSFSSSELFFFDLIQLCSCFLVGIVGVILVICGLVAKYEKPKPKKESKEIINNITSNIDGKKVSKVRYCNRCGEPISLQLGICTGWGKSILYLNSI